MPAVSAPLIRTAAVSAAASLIFSSAATAQVSFPDFSDVSRLTLNGHAAQAGNRLRVAPALGNTAGAGWYNTRQHVSVGFDTTFEFQMADHGADPGVIPGADGFAFVIQNSPLGLAELGGHGSFLGYSFIPNSLAVEFDTYKNLGDLTRTDNHISVHSRGEFNNLSNEHASKGAVDVLTDMNDGNVHTARVKYNGTAMRVFLDDLANPLLRVNYSLDKLGLHFGSAYVGFTAGTGNSWQNHDILSWKLSSHVPEPGAYVLLGAALLSAGASFTPSPVMATTSPRACHAFTMRIL